MSKNNAAVAVIGAGSWGTALALSVLENHSDVRLWSRDIAHIQSMASKRVNQKYLPDIELPAQLKLYEDLNAALNQVKHIILAVPSYALSEILRHIQTIQPKAHILSASKGLDIKTGAFQHELMQNIFGNNHFAILSGPSFAHEVARQLPTASIIASQNTETSEFFLKALQCHYFRLYGTSDLIGTQIAGTVKNILAIAAGVSDGLQLGANARAALITRGLAEMLRLGVALGAKPETFYGLSGIGDLILTANNDASRNRRFGLLLGQGKKIDAAINEIAQTVEGIHNVKLICQLARQHQVEMPITFKVEEILVKNLSPTIAAQELLARPNFADINSV